MERVKRNAPRRRLKPGPTCPPKRSARRRKGWSPERRARQAALIRTWSTWLRSTGPKTAAGKARCATNALRHGFRSRASIHKLQRVRHALRLAAGNIVLVKVIVRVRALPRIKYKPHSHADLERRRVLHALCSGLRDIGFGASAKSVE